MLGTEIHITTFVYLIFLALILSFQVIYFLLKPDSKSRFRFLILTLLFFLYNIISGLVPDQNIPIGILYQNIVAWITGISTAIYFLYFIYNEHNITPIRFLNIKNIIYSLILSFLILFLLPYALTNNLSLSRSIFLILPIFLAVACLINIILFLTKDYVASKNLHYKYRILSGGIGMISILILPVVILIFGDNQPVEHSAFSAGYFVVAFSYVKHQIYNSKIEQNLFLKLQKGQTNANSLRRDYIINLYGLSSVEREIMLLIIKGYDYYKISEEIYLSEEIVLKHVSNIFRKIKVKNRAELISMLVMENENKQHPNQLIHNDHSEIPKNIVDEILEALHHFEKTKGFLKKGLNLKELAQKLKTNTKYLSKTINDYKNSNFNSYINQLRIEHIIKLLESDPKLKNYNVKYLAEEAGFNNAEAFSRAFRKVTGKKPSNYLKELIEN